MALCVKVIYTCTRIYETVIAMYNLEICIKI